MGAPEILSNKEYSIEADIYSFGMIMWEIMEQQPFFQEFKFNSQIEIHVVNHDARPPISENFPEALKKLIPRCWHADTQKRPSASEILEILNRLSPQDLLYRAYKK